MSNEPKKPADVFVGKDYEHWREIGVSRGWFGETTREEIDGALKEMDESALLMDGFDEAFIGFSRRMNEPLLAVYSWEKMMTVLQERDGMEYEEALEYIEFNVLGAWVGEQTPIVVMPLVY
jgi:hypothetical protein